MNKNRGHTEIPASQLPDDENSPIKILTNHKSEITVIKGTSMWGRGVVKRVKKHSDKILPDVSTEK